MKLLFRIAATAIMAAACAMAQSSGGATLQGTVKDSTGAVIPNAKVTSTHVETGVTTNTVSNNEGFFVFPPSQIGKYRVHFEATGMKAWEEDVVLETGKSTDVNPVLALGDVSQTVLVSADVPMITTNEPTDSTTLDQQRIKE